MSSIFITDIKPDTRIYWKTVSYVLCCGREVKKVDSRTNESVVVKVL